MTNHLKLSYLIVIILFLAGVLYLWNNSIQDQKYLDIESCWEKEVGISQTASYTETEQYATLCNVLSTHKLVGQFAPF